MWPNPQFLADLVTFTGEIINGKLHFFVHWRIKLLSKGTFFLSPGIKWFAKRTKIKELNDWNLIFTTNRILFTCIIGIIVIQHQKEIIREK